MYIIHVGFPEDNKQCVVTPPSLFFFAADLRPWLTRLGLSRVFELYWSKPQLAARSHPNVLKASKLLLSLFRSNPSDAVSLDTPITYADRLRIRLPGDAKFALGRE